MAQALAVDLMKDAHFLANRLAYFFPSAKHRRWQTIFTIIAVNGHEHPARIEQLQKGGAPVLDHNERLYRQRKVQEAIALRESDPSITWKEIAHEIEWRYGWNPGGIKKLQRAVQKYESGQ